MSSVEKGTGVREGGVWEEGRKEGRKKKDTWGTCFVLFWTTRTKMSVVASAVYKNRAIAQSAANPLSSTSKGSKKKSESDVRRGKTE